MPFLQVVLPVLHQNSNFKQAPAHEQSGKLTLELEKGKTICKTPKYALVDMIDDI